MNGKQDSWTSLLLCIRIYIANMTFLIWCMYKVVHEKKEKKGKKRKKEDIEVILLIASHCKM